jgi:hypothetical protein
MQTATIVITAASNTMPAVALAHLHVRTCAAMIDVAIARGRAVRGPAEIDARFRRTAALTSPCRRTSMSRRTI